jgi:hypothetical protein
MMNPKQYTAESFVMDLVRNKASGKYFVVLDDAGDNDFLVITPEGKVKCLERRFFSPQNIVDLKNTLQDQILTQTQMATYSEYFKK